MKNEIDVAQGVEVSLERQILTVKSGRGSLEKEFSNPHIKMKMENGKIVIVSDIDRKKVKAIMGTWEALIRNMMKGVSHEWRAEVKGVYSHFPMKIKLEGNMLHIENFLGERKARSVPVPENLKVEIKGSEILITGSDKHKVGQLAARIEQATKVRGYDKRVFQDGCYITKKPYLLNDNGEAK